MNSIFINKIKLLKDLDKGHYSARGARDTVIMIN